MEDNKKVMIDNQSIYKMEYIYEYLAGYTTKLEGKISLTLGVGQYYDNLVIKDK